MNDERKPAPVQIQGENARPGYETPRIQVMTEREILNTFQITQSMAAWWTTSCC